MRKTIIFLSFVFLSGCAVSTNAQTDRQLQTNTRQDAVRLQNEQRIHEAEIEARQKKAGGESENAREERVTSAKRELSPFSIKPKREQKKLLLPDSTDAAKYAAFLAQPKTGLIKLFPDIGCEENARVLRVDEECLNWIPTSSFYSFREREHSREFLSDIRLKDRSFISDGFLSQGILVALGDVALENVSLAADAMKFLADYQPEAESRQALKQFNAISKGVKVGKYVYRNSMPALENMTYALRVVAYRASVYRAFQGRLFNILEGDDRADLILAFRLVRKDENGIVTLLWKELARQDSPRLARPKKEPKKENNAGK